MSEELENLSDSDKKLCRMLAGLEKIEAPKDFDFHLKARIANANPNSFEPSFTRRFAYILSAVAVMAAVSAAIYLVNFSGANNNYVATGNQSSPEKIESVLSPQPAPSFIAVNSSTPSLSGSNSFTRSEKTPLVREEKVDQAIAVSLPSEKRQPEKRSPKNNSKTYKESALSNAVTITPDKDKIENVPNNSVNSELSERQVFEAIGIETTSEDGILKVKSVRPNSLAARSGVKNNDVIETIDGQKATTNTIRGKKVELKKIGVKRGEEKIDIELKITPQ